MLLIGIDCASQPEKTGVAIGKYEDNQIEILQILTKQKDPIAPRVIQTIRDLATQRENNSPFNIILAMDAPLAWSIAMYEALANHSAGQALSPTHQNTYHDKNELLAKYVSRYTPNRTEKINLGEKDWFFRRFTDNFIFKTLQKLPLEVGADRIARATYSALELLNSLRAEFSVQLLWHTSKNNFSGIGVIEVYPAATLSVYGFTASNYKNKEDTEKRLKIIESITDFYTNIHQFEAELLADADQLDALICLLCAKNFIDSEVMIFEDTEAAFIQREGWMWVKSPKQLSY